MKSVFVCVMALALLLSGCEAESAVLTVQARPGERIVTAEPKAAVPISTAPMEVPLPTAGETAPTESANEVPYLLQLDRRQSVYRGPGYEYDLAMELANKGTFTIVEESRDPEGNLWGRLKSGAGWVDLTEIRFYNHEGPLLRVRYADEDFLLHGDYHHFSDGQEYRSPLLLETYGTLRDVTFWEIRYHEDGPAPGEAFFTLWEMDEKKPLVAELAFPGDMTMYGIRFTDEAGDTHTYTIYISGRTGAPVLQEEETP